MITSKFTPEQLAQGDKMLAEFNFQNIVGGNIKAIYLDHYGEVSTMNLAAKNGDQDGMELIYNQDEDGLYEVVEQMAGPNEDQRWTYTKTKSLKIAVRSLLKGNKNRKIISIY